MTHTILAIDDERGSLTLIKLMLNRLGYSQVFTTHHPQTGLQLFYQKRPDLLLVDDMMPTMTGVEMCRIIKSDENVAHIPVVIMSARGDVDSMMQFMECGADDVLLKPFLHREFGDFISYFVLPDSYG